LFKYTQQHTAGFTGNNWGSHILRPGPSFKAVNEIFKTFCYKVIWMYVGKGILCSNRDCIRFKPKLFL